MNCQLENIKLFFIVCFLSLKGNTILSPFFMGQPVVYVAVVTLGGGVDNYPCNTQLNKSDLSLYLKITD
jgi:hypothetical protein